MEWVEPNIGGVSHLLVPTRPTTQLPNRPLRVYPMRKDAQDDQVRAFPLSVISHRLGELFAIMPATRAPEGEWDAPQSHDREQARPYRYSTLLDESGVAVDFATGERAGVFRFRFPQRGAERLVLFATRQEGELRAEGERAVFGVERFEGMAAHVYGEFSVPVKWEDGPAGKKGQARALVRAAGAGEEIEFRYAVSYIDAAQARENLRELEGRSLEQVAEDARRVWNEALGKITVRGGTERDRRVFYTALYRCRERMVDITEGERYFSAYDKAVHVADRPFYVDNWIWDSYQTHEPLNLLLEPKRSADQIASYVRMYGQSGWMPSFAVLWGDYAAMNGNHAAAWIADAWAKGVRDFDLEKAYEGLRKNSLEATLLPWRNGPRTELDEFHDRNGYLPSLRIDEKETKPGVVRHQGRQAVAVTLENAYGDWCIAQIARRLGRKDDEELFLRRAGFYKNVFHVGKGFMWPRDESGAWIEPLDPRLGRGQSGGVDFCENNAYIYNWSVRHDWPGLFELMGGRARAEERLDEIFRTGPPNFRFRFFNQYPDATGLVGMFVMGNEPGFPIPYLYNLTGSPWKAQKRLRSLLDTWFTDTQLGMPGDEDGGGLSSWVVFTMLGIYPISPGTPIYMIGSPVFEQARLRLENGSTVEIVARGASRENKYVRAVTINGRPSTRLWFRHAEIARGGKIELEMGAEPNRALGAKAEDLPPLGMGLDPATLE